MLAGRPFLIGLLFILAGAAAPAADWKAGVSPLSTRWTKDVSPANVHPEYPRPQLVRAAWLNLNWLWDYAIRPRGELRPQQFDGSILVPFPIESALSGVMKLVGKDNRLWYRRSVSVPESWQSKRVLLHFEAVDWESEVWIDGRQIGTHRGGYAPFVFDATDTLVPGKAHELVVAVWDPSDAGTQPRGKQVIKPAGSRYTTSTGKSANRRGSMCFSTALNAAAAFTPVFLASPGSTSSSYR
jgi:hypothetical protein